MRELITAPDHDRRRSLGMLAVEWMEHFCVHGPGDVQGDPVVLDDELATFTIDAYALDARGRRLYDSAFLSRPKGRDKSGQAARFVMFEAFGPCRFAGFAEGGETFRWRDFTYRYLSGEPMGHQIRYPFIRCLATEEDQSGNTYDSVYFNLTEGPLGEGLPANAAGLTRTLLPDGGEIIPSTSGDASKDGGKETFVVFDETHLYVLAELRRLYGTVRRNLAKRKAAEPWSLETSTMYLQGEESVAEATHDLAGKILEGTVKRPRLLFDHREAPADVDLADEEQVLAALREAYGDFADVMDLERILTEIWDPRNSPQDSRRYYFNQASGASDAWLYQHELTVDATKVVADGEAITLGFDGSQGRARGVTDATALIGSRVVDGHLFEPLPTSVWEQPDGPAGKDWRVPKDLVDQAVDECFRRYRVVGFFADPARWQDHVARWESRYGAQLAVKATRDHPIEWWMTGGRSNLIVRATEQLHDALVTGEITVDGSYALVRHLLNARRRLTRSGVQIGKEHPESPHKIDAASAAILANLARLAALGVRTTDTFVPRRVR